MVVDVAVGAATNSFLLTFTYPTYLSTHLRAYFHEQEDGNTSILTKKADNDTKPYKLAGFMARAIGICSGSAGRALFN